MKNMEKIGWFVFGSAIEFIVVELMLSKGFRDGWLRCEIEDRYGRIVTFGKKTPFGKEE